MMPTNLSSEINVTTVTNDDDDSLNEGLGLLSFTDTPSTATTRSTLDPVSCRSFALRHRLQSLHCQWFLSITNLPLLMQSLHRQWLPCISKRHHQSLHRPSLPYQVHPLLLLLLSSFPTRPYLEVTIRLAVSLLLPLLISLPRHLSLHAHLILKHIPAKVLPLMPSTANNFSCLPMKKFNLVCHLPRLPNFPRHNLLLFLRPSLLSLPHLLPLQDHRLSLPSSLYLRILWWHHLLLLLLLIRLPTNRLAIRLCPLLRILSRLWSNHTTWSRLPMPSLPIFQQILPALTPMGMLTPRPCLPMLHTFLLRFSFHPVPPVPVLTLPYQHSPSAYHPSYAPVPASYHYHVPVPPPGTFPHANASSAYHPGMNYHATYWATPPSSTPLYNTTGTP